MNVATLQSGPEIDRSSIRHRNTGVDALRLIAAFSIITIHLDPTASLRPELLNAMVLMARYAVPLFFMLPFFFMQWKREEILAKCPKILARLAIIFLCASLLYIPFQIGRSGLGIIRTFFDFNILAGGTCYHLWFLSSLFFGILVVFLLWISNWEKWLGLISIMILLPYLWANHYQKIPDYQFAFLRYLNSIPMLYAGMLIRRWYLHHKKIPWWLPVSTLAAFLLQFVEVNLSKAYLGSEPAFFQLTLFSIPFSVGLLMLASLLPVSPWIICLSDLGRKYSLGIYILHVWFVTLVKKGYILLGVIGQEWSVLLMPFLVFSLTLLGLVTWEKLRHAAAKTLAKKQGTVS